MSIKFKRSKVEQIVREELEALVKELWEADKDDNKEPDVAGADKENDNVAPSKDGADMAPKVGAEKDDVPPEGEETGDKNAPAGEVPAGKDPSDTELSKDVEDQGDPGQEEKPEGGDISNDIVGRSVQSISYSPESKMMPGASEVTIQFEEIPHPLKILIGKSGMIKYHFKGSIHNEL